MPSTGEKKLVNSALNGAKSNRGASFPFSNFLLVTLLYFFGQKGGEPCNIVNLLLEIKKEIAYVEVQFFFQLKLDVCYADFSY